MNQAQMMAVNAATRNSRGKEMPLHHVEIHPELDEKGKIVKGGGHTVHTVFRDDEDGFRERTAQKPFGAGEHKEMMGHVRGELKLPEEKDEKAEGDGAQPAYE